MEHTGCKGLISLSRPVCSPENGSFFVALIVYFTVQERILVLVNNTTIRGVRLCTEQSALGITSV